jgi:CBS domain containing-hemolysin-like protein
MKNLEVLNLDSQDHLVHPEEFNEAKLDSPALSIFTDFKTHQPLEIEGDIQAVQAEFLMRKAHVHLQLVVDKSEELIGMISHHDLSDSKLMERQTKGHHREDIQVKHLMTPREHIKALSYRQLQQCTIGDVIHTLQQHHQQHCLVVDQEHHHIRGIVSAGDIARRLHIALEIENVPTFVDIFHAARPR